MPLTPDEVRLIVRQTLLEERQSENASHDEMVIRTVAGILSGFGIDDTERKEIKEDFRYLRKWRQGSDRVTGIGLTALVTLMIGGFVSALGLGIKTMLGK